MPTGSCVAQRPEAMDAVPTILLIDDEEALLRLMHLYLDRMGYKVFASGTADAALSILSDEKLHVDLAIIDLSLLPSRDVLIEIGDRYPSLRVLVCSGFPFDVSVLPERLHSRFASLQKPFLPDMLSESLEELLRRNPAA